MNRPTCTATRKDGSGCRAPALPDSELCWSHDPRQAERAAQARIDGGAKGGKLKALKGRRRRLDTHGGLAIFLNNLIHDLIEGKVEPDIAKVAIYGASVMRALNEHNVDRRLVEVERLLAQRRIG